MITADYWPSCRAPSDQTKSATKQKRGANVNELTENATKNGKIKLTYANDAQKQKEHK